MVALWNRADHYIFIIFSSCGLSANLECMYEMCSTRLAENTGRKNDAKNRHLGTIVQLYLAESSQLRYISTIGKNLLSSNISPICPYNMVNFGPLAAEIVSLVWSTPTNFNGFRFLAALFLSLFSSPNLSGRRLDVYHSLLLHMVWS